MTRLYRELQFKISAQQRLLPTTQATELESLKAHGFSEPNEIREYVFEDTNIFRDNVATLGRNTQCGQCQQELFPKELHSTVETVCNLPNDQLLTIQQRSRTSIIETTERFGKEFQGIKKMSTAQHDDTIQLLRDIQNQISRSNQQFSDRLVVAEKTVASTQTENATDEDAEADDWIRRHFDRLSRQLSAKPRTSHSFETELFIEDLRHIAAMLFERAPYNTELLTCSRVFEQVPARYDQYLTRHNFMIGSSRLPRAESRASAGTIIEPGQMIEFPATDTSVTPNQHHLLSRLDECYINISYEVWTPEGNRSLVTKSATPTVPTCNVFKGHLSILPSEGSLQR